MRKNTLLWQAGTGGLLGASARLELGAVGCMAPCIRQGMELVSSHWRGPWAGRRIGHGVKPAHPLHEGCRLSGKEVCLLVGANTCFLESRSSSQHGKPFRKGERLPNHALAFSFVRLSDIS